MLMTLVVFAVYAFASAAIRDFVLAAPAPAGGSSDLSARS